MRRADHGVRAVDVFVDINASSSKAAAHRFSVSPSRRLHVLLRHRLLVEPGGFEGFRPGRKRLKLRDQSVPDVNTTRT